MSNKTDFQNIYKENYSRVMGLCLGYVKGDEFLAKDLAQEVFVKVWQNLPQFRQQSKISTWIYRIAVNTCLQELRKKKYVDLKIDVEDESSSNSIETESRFESMYKCINSLSAENKSIILLELEAVPQNEIAEIIGISHAAIRTRIHRIKEQLSNCVKHEQF
ncbi:MAG TPA: RNA polymerase sigma factor [Aequorivita sp.]|nr:RNA polymerase sigma factor [Aequorivita sp.]